MTALQIKTARVFKPLLQPSRYKGAHGGRGSGKSHFFAELAVEKCMVNPGTRLLCIREVQKSLTESSKRLLEDKIRSLGVPGFEVQERRIRTPGGGVLVFEGMQDHNAETIKSYEAFDGVWVAEARSLSARSLELLRPTIRKPGSELWFDWNPLRKSDPIDALLRGDHPPEKAIVVQSNWRDNPWLTDELEDERRHCQQYSPETYDNIWEGAYAGVQKGAYYAKWISDARREGRIGRVAADPLMTMRAVWDIGGTGAKADACAIWICQYIGREIRVLNYYEAVGQPLAAHVNWLRSSGYDKCLCILPHDGASHDKVYNVSYESALKDAGFPVDVVPNQGAGAAMIRVHATRRLFPSIWINEDTTKPGMEALGAYHEKRDDNREVGLGPLHDWSSNAADAFGLMCCAYEAPKAKRVDDSDRPRMVQMSSGTSTAWMRR